MRALFAMGLLGMIAGQSFAADVQTVLPDGASCNEFMNCRLDFQRISFKRSEARHQSNVPALAACINGFHARPAAENVKLCERAIRQNDGLPRDRARALTVLGHIYGNMPEHYDFTQAPDETIMFRTWRKAASVDPSFADPLIAMANIYSARGQGERALSMLAEAERIDPGNWRVYTRRAIAYRNMHVVAATLPPAEKAMELAPNEFEVRREYAMALFLNKRFGESVVQYETAAGLFDPILNRQMNVYPDENVWSTLAEAYKYVGRPEQAARAMTTLLDSMPSGARSYFDFERRAQYFELAGLYQQAADDLEEAAKRAPRSYAEQYNVKRTILLAQTPTRQSAVSNLRMSLEQASPGPTIRVQLFLRNQGYNEVEISGKYDAATKRALDDCFERSSCIQVIGQAI